MILAKAVTCTNAPDNKSIMRFGDGAVSLVKRGPKATIELQNAHKKNAL